MASAKKQSKYEAVGACQLAFDMCRWSKTSSSQRAPARRRWMPQEMERCWWC